MLNIFTTFSTKHYHLYGKNFIESFSKYTDIPIYIYLEDPKKSIVSTSKNVYIWDFHKYCPEHKDYLQLSKKYKQDNFKHAADRFSYKSFTIFNHLMSHSPDAFCVWVDADVIAKNFINETWFLSLINANDFAGVLRRDWLYLESGLIIFNGLHPNYLKVFCNDLKEMYLEEKLFKESQWHDAYLINKIINRRHLPVTDLSPKHKTWHPFVEGVLGEKLDHLKGERKHVGHSKERSRYWE